MNRMFSSLFGVRYVIVRYRKNDLLKRLKAILLNPFEVPPAEIASHLVVLSLMNVVFLAVGLMIFRWE